MPRVETVKGSLSSEKLGVTLPHEHVLVDLRCNWEKPVEASLTHLINAPVSMENLVILKKKRLISKDNLTLDDPEVAIRELRSFTELGGKSLVDLTLPGIGRDPSALKKISEDTGLNIICGTGWYTAVSHPPYIKKKSIDDLCEIMLEELNQGIGNTGVKAGIIGEIGCSLPLHENEKKVLQASARAQKETKAAINIHQWPVDIKKKKINKTVGDYLDILHREGADMDKVYVSHIDIFLQDSREKKLDYLKDILNKYDVTIEFDLFGRDYYFLHPLFRGSDSKGVEALIELCEEGYEKKILISQDVCYKMLLTRYGGYGYTHILGNIVPELKARGITETQINKLLVENPKRILCH